MSKSILRALSMRIRGAKRRVMTLECQDRAGIKTHVPLNRA